MLPPDALAHVTTAGSGDGWDVLAEWTFDPLVLLVVVLPGVLYARGMRVLSRRPRLIAPWRPWLFYTGLFLNFLALCSPIHALSDDLFTMHMLQHFLLQMLAVPFILLGAPVTPILLGLPPRLRRRIMRPLVKNRGVRAVYWLLTYPPVALLAFTVTQWSWHLSGSAYDRAVESTGVHLFQHFTFYASALLLWMVVIDPRPMRSRLPYPFRMLFILVTMFQNIYMGAYITLRGDLLYQVYATGPRLWGLAPLHDQQSGGALMWVAGDTVMVIALVITGIVWFQKSSEQTRREEAEADRQAAIRRAAGVAAQPQTVVRWSTRPPR